MKLFADGKEPLIRVATSVSNSTCEVRGVEGLSELFPTASGFIDICKYVAGVEGCELSGGISSEEREAFLLLRLPRLVSDTVDFRCRRDYNVYVQRLRFITSLLDRMAS